ncbi:unnamed protein product [Symbiodinium natans]|uniref:C3H1-type domain-containing protein n=1 Tax=Symbiodinium natans TaxID=878477 RepID=A0A812NXZ4_9DINO|nr:unnamed protein product [Symbiodinium natans]
MTKSEQKKAVKFTRMCKFWRTNECKMGTDCTFAHDTSELRPSPKPCFEFSKTGSCARGQACRFVHTVDMNSSGTFNDILPTMQEVSYVQNPPAGSVAFEAPACMGVPMPQLGQTRPALQDLGSIPCLRPPPGIDDMGMIGLEPHGLRWSSLKVDMDRDSCRSSLSELSLGLECAPLPIPKAADLEQMWAADDATVATQSLTSTMCLSTTPTSFSDSDGSDGMSFWL